MRIFGGLKDCECACTPIKKPSEGVPKKPTIGRREDLASGQCCAGELEGCCTEEEDEPDTRPGLWARYLERIAKSTGGVPPACC